MSYEKFAYLYDELMTDAPYEEWVSFVLNVLRADGITKGSILDVGCGTGTISISLSQQGYDVTAVDVSDEMLLVAREKSEEAGVTIQFFQQDMRELEGLGSFDLVCSFCDSINYLTTEEEVEQTIFGMTSHLKENGLFIFDVHSIFKIEHVLKGNTFAHNGEDISYIWECFEGEASHSVEHDLSFFVKNEVGLYERADELHTQRTYPIEFFRSILEKVGLKIISITGDFSLDQLNESDHRWFFVAQKST